MRHTIFMNSITQIDFSWVSSDGRILGNSLDLSVELSRPALTKGEEVVLDFGTAKMEIKRALDSHQTGLDHKLWVFNDSACGVQLIPGGEYLIYFDDGRELYLCADAIHRLTCDSGNLSDVERHIERYLDNYMALSSNTLTVKVLLKSKSYGSNIASATHDGLFRSSFSYTHGLPLSSSFGCQHAVHGHKSFFAVTTDPERLVGGRRSEVDSLIARIVSTLCDKYIAPKYSALEDSGMLNIARNAVDRGHQSVRLPQDQVLLIDGEPTIENIASFILHRFGHELRALGAKRFYVSEGLTKGAVTDL